MLVIIDEIVKSKIKVGRESVLVNTYATFKGWHPMMHFHVAMGEAPSLLHYKATYSFYNTS